MVQQALNYLLTEDRHSFSKRKCIIVFTEDWISSLMLSSIYRLYDEKVKIINVNFEDQTEKPGKGFSTKGIDISYFDTSEYLSIVEKSWKIEILKRNYYKTFNFMKIFFQNIYTTK